MKIKFVLVLLLAFPAMAWSDESTLRPLDICLFAGNPPSDIKYDVTKKLKLGKGSYGRVTDILPRFSRMAYAAGSDAVVQYYGSQRFGFWPWRFIRPVVRGKGVKLHNEKGLSCAEMGGKSVSEVIETNKAPN